MRKIAIRYGLWMFLGFTVFFFVMHFFGFSQRYDLRIFNGVIHLSLMYLAIREYRNSNEESVNNYVSGVAMGMYTSVIGVLPFTIVMFLYLVLNPDFMANVTDNADLQRFITPLTASLFIFTEGIAVSLIGSYIETRIIDASISRARSKASQSSQTLNN